MKNLRSFNNWKDAFFRVSNLGTKNPMLRVHHRSKTQKLSGLVQAKKNCRPAVLDYATFSHSKIPRCLRNGETKDFLWKSRPWVSWGSIKCSEMDSNMLKNSSSKFQGFYIKPPFPISFPSVSHQFPISFPISFPSVSHQFPISFPSVSLLWVAILAPRCPQIPRFQSAQATTASPLRVRRLCLRPGRPRLWPAAVDVRIQWRT